MLAPAARVTLFPEDGDADDFVSHGGRSFGALLRRYRIAARLPQEALAERAGLSASAISTLERGTRHAPYQATIHALAMALQLSKPERAALEAAVTRSRAPRPLATVTPVPTPARLPHPPTPLVDRVEELATAQALLHSDAVRLLTLTGPAGVGKSRLALQVAASMRTTFPVGVWFVDLAPLHDPELVLSTIAQALEVQARDHQMVPEALRAALGERQVLVVLDNFEQVLAAAVQLASLLAACPGLKLLVTSRARLRLRWEHTLPLAPLAVPAAEEPQTLETLAAIPAVALFVDRARAANPAFALTAQNAPAVAALCRYLDGLPLALELAAARANVLGPTEMLSCIGGRLPALSWDAPDLPERHQSLRTAMDGSYGLLPAAEQALLRRLAVVAGGWTHEAAVAIASLGEQEQDTMEGLGRLIDASLVQVSPDPADGPRFRLLETVREYALEQLNASGERAAAERAHAAYFLALAERAEPHLKGPEQVDYYHRLQREQDNLRAALVWAAAHDETEVELRLVGCLTYFWWAGGYLHEACQWLEDALARSADRREVLQVRRD
jgi:predicted ATPase/DNA-binding XRE family transcriptional regulator